MRSALGSRLTYDRSNEPSQWVGLPTGSPNRPVPVVLRTHAQAKSRAFIDVFDRSSEQVKISPLADWTTEDVIRYTREREG